MPTRAEEKSAKADESHCVARQNPNENVRSPRALEIDDKRDERVLIDSRLDGRLNCRRIGIDRLILFETEIA